MHEASEQPVSHGSRSRGLAAVRRSAAPLSLCILLASSVIAAPAYFGARASLAWNATPFSVSSVPTVLQVARNDCGPAALAALLIWADRATPLATITSAARLGPDGISLGEFARVADAFGLTGAWYHLQADRLATVGTPFVAHVTAAAPSGASQLGHLVVVWAAGSGAVLLSDPAVGASVMPLDEFARRYTGRAYVLGADS
ncbi:MAG TPA: cysteine peptidase family C39 domain-containing protein [Trueperaceae bacterium]|nr:cysteine peptidase family C39 domain-containing protein [Trueperaceae bacterium]